MSLFSTISKTAVGLFLAAGMTATALPAAMAADYTKENPLKVALVLHGTLGDKSFFDDAAAGMKQAEADLPVTVKVIELGYDRSKWQAGLADAVRTLQHPEVLVRPSSPDGVFAFDVARADHP